MAKISIEIDIAANGTVTVTPNPATAASGDTVKWQISSDAHHTGTLTVLLPGGEDNPFGNKSADARASHDKSDNRNSLEPIGDPLKWPSGAVQYFYRASYVATDWTSEVTAVLTKSGPTPVDLFWDTSFKTLYGAYYQELASEALGSRWEIIDRVTSILVAIASGSAVAGWAIWSTSGGKILWSVLGGAASLASIFHSRLAVPARVKEQEELRRRFQHLRLSIEAFRTNLEIGLITATAAKTEFDKLQAEYRNCVEKTKKDIAYTKGLRANVEERLRGILKEGGYST